MLQIETVMLALPRAKWIRGRVPAVEVDRFEAFTRRGHSPAVR